MELKRYQPPTRADMQGWQDSMRSAFFEAVSAADMRAIVKKLVADAKKGNQGAIKLLLSYGIGSSQVHVDRAVIVQQQGSRPLPNEGDDFDAQSSPTVPLHATAYGPPPYEPDTAEIAAIEARKAEMLREKIASDDGLTPKCRPKGYCEPRRKAAR